MLSNFTALDAGPAKALTPLAVFEAGQDKSGMAPVVLCNPVYPDVQECLNRAVVVC